MFITREVVARMNHYYIKLVGFLDSTVDMGEGYVRATLCEHRGE